MTAQALSANSNICLARHLRSARMREMNRQAGAENATEFRSGMHAKLAPGAEQRLAQRQLLALPDADLNLLCLAGELWLTRNGDSEDYILSPGQRIEIRRGERAAVQALRPSQVRLDWS